MKETRRRELVLDQHATFPTNWRSSDSWALFYLRAKLQAENNGAADVIETVLIPLLF